MIKLILFDLDDTLLAGSMAMLWSHYFSLLGGWMTERLALPDFLPRLHRATQQTTAAPDGMNLTNQERFLRSFCEGLSMTEADVMAAFDEFYATQYPQLKRAVTRVPAARAVVEWLFAHGYAVGIATNPLFPRAAIEQRLAWAGIPVEEFDYALVTALENMHTTKPYPAYYDEILAHTGHAPAEALMVGDDLERDLPATQVGMRFYWIHTPGNAAQSPPPGARIAGAGALDDFARQVRDEGWLETVS